MANEQVTKWFARWRYGRPTLCRVDLTVRKKTYKVVQYQTFLGFWAYGIVYPKESPFFFDDLTGALGYLKKRGLETEAGIQDNLREVQAQNKQLDDLIAELEKDGTVDFFADQ